MYPSELEPVKFPCIVFSLMRKVSKGAGEFEDKKEFCVLPLNTSWATLEHVSRIAKKPTYRIVGYANLLNDKGEPINEHIGSIQAFADAVLQARQEAAVEPVGIKAKAEARARRGEE